MPKKLPSLRRMMKEIDFAEISGSYSICGDTKPGIFETIHAKSLEDAIRKFWKAQNA